MMPGNPKHVLHVWDYHHGQSTRVVVGGCPPLRGATIREKQDYLAQHYDHLRALICREPRGHRNMLGAFLTDPVTPDGDVGIIFVHPDGYFEACGDSTFSAAVALLESGIVPRTVDNGEQMLQLDGYLGRIPVRATIEGGQVRAVAMQSSTSYALGRHTVIVEGVGEVQVDLGWGGLLYAFVASTDLGLRLSPDSSPSERATVLDAGTKLWRAAKEQLRADIPGIQTQRPVDLVTIVGDIPSDNPTRQGPVGSRVANFYAPQTMGRTPSGTGSSARVAVLYASGKLGIGEPFFHESPVGLRFKAQVLRADNDGVIVEIETMSYLMNVGTLVVREDDPFATGFAM